MITKIKVSIDDTMLKFASGNSGHAQGMEYESTFVSLSCKLPGEVLSFKSGRQFGKIRSFEWIDRSLISPRTGRPIRSSPKVQVVIELLPEFVIASTEGKDRGVVHLVRSVKLSWEMEGWRMVSTPEIEYIQEEILIEASQSLGAIKEEVAKLEVNTIG